MPSLIAVLGANISPLVSKLKEARQRAKKEGSGIAADFKEELSGRLAGIASVAGVALGVERAVELGGKISDLSNRLGMSTDAVQEWDYALRMNGSTMESAATFFEKLAVSRALVIKGGDVAKGPSEAFRKLGVSVEELKSKRIEDIAAKIAKVFEGVDPQRFIDSLKEVGGKGAGEMVATFSQGFSQMAEDAHKFGQVIRSEVVNELDSAGDQIDRLKMSMTVGLFAPIATWLSELGGILKNEFLIPMGFALNVLWDGIKNRMSPSEMGNLWVGVIAKHKEIVESADKAADAILAAKRKAAGNTPAALAAEEANATRQRQNEELEKINQLIEAEQRRAVRSMMNAREREQMDRAELAMIQQKIAATKDPVEKAKLKLEYEKGLSELQTDMKGDTSGKQRETFSNQFTAIGGFGSSMTQGPEMRQLDYARRSESHLEKMVNLSDSATKALEKLVRRAELPDSKNVTY